MRQRPRFVSVALAAVLLTAWVFSSGDEARCRGAIFSQPELQAWILGARKRGEPLTWAAVVGEAPPEDGNGATLLLAAEDCTVWRTPPVGWRPTPPLDQIQRTALNAYIVGLSEYERRLRVALSAPRFVVHIDTKPPGYFPEWWALANASRYLELRSMVGDGHAIEATLWLLRLLDKWEVRTWYEGVCWDALARDSLRILDRVLNVDDINAGAANFSEIVDLLERVERKRLLSLPRRLFARRIYLLDAVESYLCGRSPARPADGGSPILQRLLPERAKAQEESAAGRARDALLLNPRLLTSMALAELTAYDEALHAAQSYSNMRAQLRANSLAGSPEIGDFASFLALSARLRMGRVATHTALTR